MLRTFIRRLFAKGAQPMLKVGERAPEFEVLDHNGRTVRLADYRGQRVVLWFFPKASTPG
jgi:thioredoxin-dependent peroxiredoxin